MRSVNKEQRKFEEKRFVEDVGLFFEQYGLPRMAGRVLGWLLISDPPHQSIGELSEALMASKGSISTMTRLLIQLGLIERTSLPGLRRDYFCIKSATDELITQGIVKITTMRQLSERGLRLLEGKSPQLRERLKAMRDVSAFFEKQYPILLECWEGERQKAKQQAA